MEIMMGTNQPFETDYQNPVTEDELIKRAADKGNNERVSLEKLNENIASEHYYNPEELHPLTICVLKLANGFMVMGHSAPAMEGNFDEAIGRRLAREQAVKQIWQLMGYALKERTHRDKGMLSQVLVPAQGGFETYIGTKVIHAKPCTRKEYHDLRGWDIPDDEDAGYLLEYTDKIENMVPGFQGYVSWSPKGVFERAYRSVHDLLLKM
jgi:hypothetical protein